MTVFYRMCGIPSTNPSPIFQDNKFALNMLCLRSFVAAFKEVNPTVIFINDKCGEEYREMIDTIVPFKHKMTFENRGINETMLLSYELAKENSDDTFFFAECDYFYLPNAGKFLVQGIEELGLVSPYDHLNFYLDPTLHSEDQKIRLVNGRHWRTTERNTMTYGIKKAAFEDLYGILQNYGYLDNDVWHASKAKGYKLWTPIPSLATHMVKDFMSPGIDWKEQFETYI